MTPLGSNYESTLIKINRDFLRGMTGKNKNRKVTKIHVEPEKDIVPYQFDLRVYQFINKNNGKGTKNKNIISVLGCDGFDTIPTLINLGIIKKINHTYHPAVTESQAVKKLTNHYKNI